MSDPRSATLKEMAATTPLDRDRYVDFLRALSIGVVVLGHWLMAIIYMQDGRLSGANALDVIPGLWVATWVLQVMPIFFLVGGFSNLTSWRAVRRRGETYRAFLRSRIDRLMRPTIVFVITWTGVAACLTLVAPDFLQSVSLGAELLAKPLWFLSVYVLAVALAPVMIVLHERFGGGVLVVLAVAAVVVDLLRVGFDVPVVGYLNFAFVWLFVHQLGFFYADGRLLAFGRRQLWFGAIGALATLAVLTGTGIYSPSMVGMATERASNNSPPSICLLVLTIWLTCVVLLARPAITKWLERPRAWMGVIAANSLIMTVFLWHLTVLMIVSLVLLPLGFPQPEGGSALWWAWRPAWLAALAIGLSIFVVIFGRFERGSGPRRDRKPAAARRTASTAFGVGALVLGLAGLAQFGFAHMGVPTSAAQVLAQPVVDAALIVVGHRLLTSRDKGAAVR